MALLKLQEKKQQNIDLQTNLSWYFLLTLASISPAHIPHIQTQK